MLKMKKLTVLILSCLSVACIRGYNPTYSFNQIQVVNLSGTAIEDVSASVAGTAKKISCEKVVKNAVCNDYFGRRAYPQQGIELSWIHGDGSRKSEVQSPPIPSFYSPAIPLRLVFEINEAGSVKANYEQQELDRDGGMMYF